MRIVKSAALGVLALLLLTPAVHAFGFDLDADEIAAACMEKATAAADHCVATNETLVEECNAKIAAILEKGQERRAARVAERCARMIQRHSDACVAAIEGGCDICVMILEYLEADPGLIADVEAHCAAEIARVEASRDDSIASLDAPLLP